MSDGAIPRTIMEDVPNWEQRYRTMEVIAAKRLEVIDHQDGEIADLRRQLAALRARAK